MCNQQATTPDIRVVVMEDHGNLCDALTRSVSSEPGMICCGHFNTGQETIEAIPRLRPDVVSLDLNMPDVNGLTVLRRIREVSPETRCVVLSGHADDAYVRESFDAGAMGYVFKEDIRDLIEAIHTLAAGEYFISDRFRDSLSLDEIVKPADGGQAGD